MIDLLLRFPSLDVAAQVGQALGYTFPDGQGGWRTTSATLTLAVCILGEHFYPSGQTETGPEWEQIPVMTGDGKWWVMIRSLIDVPVPPEIEPFVIQRAPTDPLQPQAQWA